jgi:hypothetical protein
MPYTKKITLASKKNGHCPENKQKIDFAFIFIKKKRKSWLIPFRA